MWKSNSSLFGALKVCRIVKLGNYNLTLISKISIPLKCRWRNNVYSQKYSSYVTIYQTEIELYMIIKCYNVRELANRQRKYRL